MKDDFCLVGANHAKHHVNRTGESFPLSVALEIGGRDGAISDNAVSFEHSRDVRQVERMVVIAHGGPMVARSIQSRQNTGRLQFVWEELARVALLSALLRADGCARAAWQPIGKRESLD